MHLLFSYGTLRDPAVQEAVFGRPVACRDARLPGFRIDEVVITDAAVIAASGLDRHPILRRGSPGDVVAGATLELDDEGMAAADRYEVDDYIRVEVTLADGRTAWVYVGAEDAEDAEDAEALPKPPLPKPPLPKPR